MKTLIISKQDAADLLDMAELIQETEKAYITYADNTPIRPTRTVATVDDTAIVVNMPGYLPHHSLLTVKVNTKCVANQTIGLPFLIGAILLIDKHTGHIRAMIDSSLITAMRTGAAGAVAIQHLALANANKVTLIGAGMQGEWQIRALACIKPIEKIWIYDLDNTRANHLANKLHHDLNLDCEVVTDLKTALQKTQIIITTTHSKTPILTYDMLKPGMHINAFGADQPGKVEMDTEIYNRCSIYVDDLTIACTQGALNVAYLSNQLTNTTIHEIGHVLKNKKLGRISEDQITVFGNTGLAFQDLIACVSIYERAMTFGKGTWIEFDSSY